MVAARITFQKLSMFWLSHKNEAYCFVWYLAMPPSSWNVGQIQAPLHMGVAALPVRFRIHRGKESITEMWRPEMY